jgi:hypothetical protein
MPENSYNHFIKRYCTHHRYHCHTVTYNSLSFIALALMNLAVEFDWVYPLPMQAIIILSCGQNLLVDSY